MKDKGFTFIEIMVVIAIFVLAGSVVLSMFGNVNRHQSVDKNVVIIKSVLERARSLTLSSKDSSQYGVHLDGDRVVLFKGNLYSEEDSFNITTELNILAQISDIVLVGGGQDIIFERLTGETLYVGNITVSLVSDPSVEQEIIIYGTGVVE